MMKKSFDRRRFLRMVSVGTASGIAASCETGAQKPEKAKTQLMPNLLFIFADQWRAMDTGYAGNSDVITPNLDSFSQESVNFTNAVSGCPVCCPYRASLMTGQYPLTHGVFMNDLCLNTEAVSIAQAYNDAGYETGYIGKWHLDGHGRSSFIPRERRQGFKFWKTLECSHDYNNSFYYGDENIKRKWDGYDAIAQTREAQNYIRGQSKDKPFALFLSWGPPHAPYETAPQKYRDLFKDAAIKLHPNVPKEKEAEARKAIRGYYAHMAALDDCIGEILNTISESGFEDDTIVVFTSDHGDMLYSHGQVKKQQPYEESLRVPFLLRYPAKLGNTGKKIDMPINTPDIMPTLLGLSGVGIPGSVEGSDFSGVVNGADEPHNDAALIQCPQPFGQWARHLGGKEYRGVTTRRYTYARDLNGPWILFDNLRDPYQLDNLCNKSENAELQKSLEKNLMQKLKDTNDEFLPGMEYVKRWGYTVDETETVPYKGDETKYK